jgi:hypothetical protein
MAAFRTAKEILKPCPPDREEIGRSGWTLVSSLWRDRLGRRSEHFLSQLHTMAAYYPDKPTPEEKKLMMGFLVALARFYPCSHCAEGFRADMESVPPRYVCAKCSVLEARGVRRADWTRGRSLRCGCASSTTS